MPTQENGTTTYLQLLLLFSRGVRFFLLNGALMGLCWMGTYSVLTEKDVADRIASLGENGDQLDPSREFTPAQWTNCVSCWLVGCER